MREELKEQKKLAQELFEGKAYEDLTDEEKQLVVKAWEQLKKTLGYIIDGLRKTYQEVVGAVISALKAWKKDVDKKAANGDAEAQYTKYTIDLVYWEGQLAEIEMLLQVTKKTNARRKLEDRKKYVMYYVTSYRQLQEEARVRAGIKDGL